MAHSITILPSAPQANACSFAHDVVKGLQGTPKAIPSMHFYDDRGSELFAKITQLDAYYPTRTEEAILRANAKTLSALVGHTPTDIIELGAGCSEKIWIVLDQLVKDGRDFVFRPVDISHFAMSKTRDATIKRHGNHVSMRGVIGNYPDALAHISEEAEDTGRKKVILFFGSNLGNMNDAQAIEFLLKLRTCMKKEDVLILGVDLKKDLHLIHRAYDDPEGVTAEFNLNLLDRMNRELGANFNRANFVHHPFYDPSLHAMVSWLVATKDHTVSFERLPLPFVRFREGEGIRTEISRKYSVGDIRRLAERSRFSVDNIFTDEKRWFADVVLRPA